MPTATLYGSHGELTFDLATGHIIRVDHCDCEDCATFGDYTTIALIDVPNSDAEIAATGHGDILGAALIHKDGGYSPAWLWDETDGSYHDHAERRLLPAS